jgi:hypothetical protein
LMTALNGVVVLVLLLIDMKRISSSGDKAKIPALDNHGTRSRTR